ncbi:MAG TPA: glycogen debranching N-terminal domain-containing protein [Candidatus Dormibacteraeota bacterium]|nr:glycogen debranching N-terminal domain-containing protein [Candidatus Dormibacteraeota bacterium]
MILKQDGFFAASASDGSMRPDSPDGHGLWFTDTRFLSEYRLLLDGREPELLDVRTDAGWAAFDLTANELHVHRVRYIDCGLHERITIANAGTVAIDTELELVFASDLAAMMAVRGVVPELMPAGPAHAEPTSRGLRISRDGADRATQIAVQPAGTRHKLRLAPGELFSLVVDVTPEVGSVLAAVSPSSDPPPQPSPLVPFDAGLARATDAYRSWAAGCASYETDNHALNELLDQSRDDLRMLCEPYPTGMYPAAGTPWFAVPFGRDGLITALQMLPTKPDVARGVLRYLAEHQGRHIDADREEEPGKILHEVRSGEVVERGLWPNILFGTIDATPLFLCVLAETADWTGDDAIFDELWPAAEAALAWCEKYGDRDGDGYIEYPGGRARNQGWKDSNASINHVDGSEAPHPIALCEVQGYLYRGLLGMARKKRNLKSKAAKLQQRFDRDFWVAREGFVAYALDGTKRPVEQITSNPGHCLWAGILPQSRAAAVAARMVSPELFSGWGVRTLSTREVTYDACSYHNGSVWPHDSAIAAAGLRTSGFPVEAERIARAVLEAGMAFPKRRQPELFCGNERESNSPPVIYRSSCSPQAWAAGSTFQLMTALLGLEADARRMRLRIAPVETPLWRRLEVNGLHFAGHRIDFSVEGTRVKLGALPPGIKVDTHRR